MHIAIDIPDEMGNIFAAQGGGVARAVLEAVAIEAYRSGAITALQVQQMLGLRSRWETETLLQANSLDALDLTIHTAHADVSIHRIANFFRHCDLVLYCVRNWSSRRTVNRRWPRHRECASRFRNSSD